MSFATQVARNFSVEHCSECASPFWLKRDKAIALSAAGKALLCRSCQSLRGWDVSHPEYARHLTDDELAEMEVEIARNGLAYEYAQPKPEPAPISSPSPSPMEKTLSVAELRDKLTYFFDVTKTKKKDFAEAVGLSQPSFYAFLAGGGLRTKTRVRIEEEMRKRGWLDDDSGEATETDEEELLRVRLKNSLQASGVTVGSFAWVAGLNRNTVEMFVDGTGKRRTQARALDKIKAAMNRRGWLKDEADTAEAVAPQVAKEIKAEAEEAKACPPFSSTEKVHEAILREPAEPLTSEEKYTVIAAIMAHVPSRERAVGILDKLFPPLA